MSDPATGVTGAPEDPEVTRSWWRELLGAWRDPAATFEVGAPEQAAARVERRAVALSAHGTTLEATLLCPDAEDPPPVVIVPFYDVATVLGERTARTRHWPAARLRSCAYAWPLVASGFAVLVVPWWFEHVTAPDASTASLQDRYGPGAALHRRTAPGTGLGRSVGDLFVAVDAVVATPSVDTSRIGVFGHSLGAKLALHLAALDTRVGAGVAHEPGLGFAHSNWSDPWYLGAAVPSDRDQDEVLGLVAPRPFLLAGGGDADGAHNHDLVERARTRWPDGSRLETLHHDGGHPPPAHILAGCCAWLSARLDAGRPRPPERTAPR